MSYRVFSQHRAATLPLVELLERARRHFHVSLSVVAQSSAAQPLQETLLEVELPEQSAGRFRVVTRASSEADLDAAQSAERRGRATGMGELAGRCARVWEVSAVDAASDAALHVLCALLASVALGPVLPPDGATLYGVRGARERAEALRHRGLERG